MNRTFLPLALAALAGLALASCGKRDEAEHDGHAHEEHVAPHGGELLELGDHDAHVEILHDHVGGAMTVWVLGADAKTTLSVEAPVVQIEHQGKPVEFPLTATNPGADGKATEWKGSHEGLKTDPWNGRITVKIGDKTWRSPLEGEPHAH